MFMIVVTVVRQLTDKHRGQEHKHKRLEDGDEEFKTINA